MKIILDRVDTDDRGNSVAVFEVGEKTVAFKEEQMPNGFAHSLIPNAIVECEIEDGCIIHPVILLEETKQREEEMKKRLLKLAKRDAQ